MAEKMPLDILERTEATGGTYDYVETDQVPPGEIWCLEHYAFENETGNRGTVRLFVGSQAVPVFLKEHEAPLADELVFEDAPLFIREGQKLGFRQASCTASDVLKLYAVGYRVHGKFIP